MIGATYSDSSITLGGLEKSSRIETNAAEFCRVRLGIAPDARQLEVLLSETKRGILNCTRQWGKSLISAVKAVYQAYTRPESLVLVASPSARQSGEFLRKAAGMVRKLGIRPVGDGDNEISLLLPNGSRIVGLPGNDGTVRGFSAVSLLMVDEASRVSEEMYKALRPMLAVGNGDLWLMSTPYGRRGFFFDTWEHGGPEWHKVTVTAADCPRIQAAFLEEERRALGLLWFRQEYGCEFVDNGVSLFEDGLLEGSLEDDLEPMEF